MRLKRLRQRPFLNKLLFANKLYILYIKEMKGNGGGAAKILDQRSKDLESLATHLNSALKNNAGMLEGYLMNYVR